MSNVDVIKTYVWHGDKCFFVSTMERRSSAAANPCRYNETIVWEVDWKTGKRGEMLWMGEAGASSIRTHQRFVQQIYDNGEVADEQRT